MGAEKSARLSEVAHEKNNEVSKVLVIEISVPNYFVNTKIQNCVVELRS